MLIRMKDFTDSASNIKDAELLKSKIENALNLEETVIIDFAGIQRYSILFFNYSLLYYAEHFGKAKYDKTFNIINLDSFGEQMYNWFYEDSVEHPDKCTPEQEKYIKEMINHLDE